MVSSKQTRVVKVVRNQGEYVPIPFSDLRKGDVFMLYEADGTGLGRFVASSDAYLNDNEIWEIECHNG